MVLTQQATYLRLFSIFLLAFMLNACSALHSQKHHNRSPQSPIIPVITTPAVKAESQNQQTPRKTVNQAPETIRHEAAEPPKTVRPSPSDVLGSILDLAKKAINKKQWLRAQHHLEHALRIAPKDAHVFWLYANVYEGLGIKDREINMLKRSLFLAKPNSEIYQLASEKLAHHTP